MTVETRYKLPPSQATTRWVNATDGLRVYLITCQKRIEERRRNADKLRRDADRELEAITQSLAMLDQLLPPKTGSTGVLPISAPAAVAQRPSERGPWSKTYACCRACGTTERKHTSRGLCTTCYFKPEAEQDRLIAERTRATANQQHSDQMVIAG
jgi:hypothetical protein